MRDPWEVLDRHAVLLVALMTGIVVAVHLVYWVYAPYNGDEGIYLYASRLVMEGKILYQDTFFHQFPLFPYFYGSILEPLGGGLYLGRLLSVVLGVSAFLLVLPVARAVAGNGGAAAYAILYGLNFWAISNMVRVKHYALTTFLLSLGAYFLLAYAGRKTARVVGALLAFALAAATRISTAPVLLFAWWYLVRRERENRRLTWTAHLTFVSSVFLVFSYALWVPVLHFLYMTFGYALSNYERRGVYRYFTWQLRVFRGLVIFRIPTMALLILLPLGRLSREWRSRLRSAWLSPTPTIFLGAVCLTLFVVHFFVGHVHEDYHVIYFPLLAVLAAQAFRGLAAEARQRGRLRAFSAFSVFLAILTVFTGVRYGFFKRDAFQVPSTLPHFYAQAEVVARRTSPQGADILTFYTIVPYLAHRQVAHGFEYGVDTYRPTATPEVAKAWNFLTAEQAGALIRSGRAQAIGKKFLLQYLWQSDRDGTVAAAVRDHYEEEMGYYYLRSPAR